MNIQTENNSIRVIERLIGPIFERDNFIGDNAFKWLSTINVAVLTDNDGNNPFVYYNKYKVNVNDLRKYNVYDIIDDINNNRIVSSIKDPIIDNLSLFDLYTRYVYDNKPNSFLVWADFADKNHLYEESLRTLRSWINNGILDNNPLWLDNIHIRNIIFMKNVIACDQHIVVPEFKYKQEEPRFMTLQTLRNNEYRTY